MWRVKTNMEGTLYKWTNYLSGWQPRWFILDNGVLSYYKSQEDVNNGCKGSIKMTVCDVVVHSSDSTRLDLIIPAEQHFYLRASTPHERQQWLIALGTSKACLTNGRSLPEIGEMSPDIVKTKKSELRLYCDLLMEQVNSVKQSISSTNETPDIQKLNDATSLLSATCDTFIQTLEDCMKIANATISYEVPPHYTMDVPLLSPTKSNSKMGSRNHIRRSVDRSMKSSTSDLKELKSILNNSTSDQILSSKTTNGVDSLTSDSSDYQVSGCEDSSDGSRTSESWKMSTSPENDSKPNHIPVSPSRDRPTFFSTMPHSFSQATFSKSEEILVEPFLNLCNSILPIFDKLNSTAFAPIKMDFSGNIRKLQAKRSAELTTLQKIIRSEIKSREHDNSNSATVATLWLKRSLEFIRELLVQILSGQLDLTLATTEAYSRTLKPFHSWVVRGVFGLAVKAVPTYDNFVTQLCPANNDSGSISKSERILYSQMEAYTSALAPIIDSLNNFYRVNNLNFDEQV